MALRRILESSAVQSPDAPALIFLTEDKPAEDRFSESRGESRLSFAEIDRAARSRAAWLQRHAKAGDRALLAYPAGLEFVVTFLGCLYARVIPVPVALPGRSRSRDESLRRLAAVRQDCQPNLLLSNAASAARLRHENESWRWTDLECEADPEMFVPPGSEESPEDIAFLQYTSGSTGNPRGVAVSCRTLDAQFAFHRSTAAKRGAMTIYGGWLPHHHDFGLVGFCLCALAMGSTHVFMSPSAFLQRPLRWLEMISKYRVTYSGGPNFAYELCVQAAGDRQRQADASALDLSCWAIASVGGEAAQAATLRRFAEMFAPYGFRHDAFLPAYGLAEAGLCVAARQGMKTQVFDRAALGRNVAVPRGETAQGTVKLGPADLGTMELVAYGEPLSGHQIRIVDPETHEALGNNRLGEIWLRGESTANRFWNNEAETLARFQAELASGEGGAYLRTGDWGFLHEGDLFVTGRLKDVLIVRGENHSPDDVEATIRSVDARLQRGAVAVVQTADQLVGLLELQRGDATDDDSQLCAAVARAVSEAHGLRLGRVLVVAPHRLPRTTSGKVSRQRCRDLAAAEEIVTLFAWSGDEATMASQLPDMERATGNGTEATRLGEFFETAGFSGEMENSGEIEARLLARIRTLLENGRIGLHDNLFSCGCDSLAAQQILGWIRETFYVELPAQVVYDEPTAAALARRVRLMQRGESALGTNDSGEAHAGMHPETRPAQAKTQLDRLEELGHLILHELQMLRAGSGRVLNAFATEAHVVAPKEEQELVAEQREMAALLALHPEAEPAFVRATVLELREAVQVPAAYAILREVANRHEALRMRIDGVRQRILPYVDPDVTAVTLGEESEIPEWLRAERRRGFDLQHAPLWRAALVRTESDAKTYLVLTAHALAADAWSLGVMANEFVQIWQGRTPDAARQCGELWETEESARESVEFGDDRAYWMRRIGHQPPVLEFAHDKPQRLKAAYEAACRSVECDGALRRALVEKGGRSSATLFQTLLAAYFVLLHRCSGQDRVMVAVESSMRGWLQRHGESVVGCCNRLVPVVLDFSDERTTDVLKSVRDEAIAAIRHQAYTLSILLEELRIPQNAQRPVRIDATMSLCTPAQHEQCAPRFDLVAAASLCSPVTLALDVRDLGSSLRLDFTYNRAVFDDAEIERLVDAYRRLLETMAAEPDADLLRAEIIDERERLQIEAWSRCDAGAAQREGFRQRFAAQVESGGEAIAVKCPRRSMTYRELDAVSETLAAQMTGCDAPAALLFPRGCEMLSALVATIKVGAVCVPLDPGDPALLLRQRLKRSGAGILLFPEALREVAETLTVGMPECALVRAVFEAEPDGRDGMERGMAPALADAGGFVLFDDERNDASPVTLDARAALRQINAKADALELKPGDVVAQSSLWLWESLAALTAGATVCVPGDADSPEQMLQAWTRHEITVARAAPHLLRAMLEIGGANGFPRRQLDKLRWIVAEGELPADLCRRWISCYPNTKFLHEMAVDGEALLQQVVEWPPAPSDVSVPAGRPVAGVQAYILDRRGEPAPLGVPGELCFRRGEEDSFSGRAALRRSGVLARFRADGAIECRGSFATQLAVQGWRVEPMEIEVALRRSPAVFDAAVMVSERADGETVLAAYVCLRELPATSAGILRAMVRNMLPPALVPAVMIFVEQLPRNAAGIVRWSALPVPEHAAHIEAHEPPSTPTEEAIAEIWRQVLHSPAIGIHDDLFALGGTSLRATEIAARIGSAFHFRMPVSEIFRAPTIAGTALYVEQQRRARDTGAVQFANR